MRKVHDHYFERAKRENYRARSVYKLEALQKKFSLLRRGARVLDLGCAPGSWLQYAARIVGKKGLVVGVDRKRVSPPLGNVETIEGDVATFRWEGALFHVVLSDLAPATTGVKSTDHHRSVELFRTALAIARRECLVGGDFAGKIFQGEAFEEVVEEMRGAFERVRIFKPPATRKESREIYLVGLGRRKESTERSPLRKEADDLE